MTKRRGRRGPSDPAIILARMAERRAAEALAAKDPANWGVGDNVMRLDIAASNDVDVGFDPQHRDRLVRVIRSDAFSAVSMTPDQDRAAKRYWRDWCHRAGVLTDDARPSEDAGKVDHSPGLAPGQMLTQRMIDAGKALDEAHREIGRGDVRLLRNIAEPLIMRGEFHIWRWLVQQVTGETERHAQAAAVRSAVENLRLAYEVIDERKRKDRETKRRAEEAAAAVATAIKA